MATAATPKRKVLVTGCAGFIGHHLCKQLVRLDIEVVGFDECNSFYGPAIKEENIKELSQYENFEFITSLGNLKFISTVFHLAGQASIRFCEDHPEEAVRCNQELTDTLLRQLGPLTHVIFASSSSVYGDAPTPWGESTPTLPKGVYGTSKLRCEELIRERGPPATVFRPFSIVGAGVRPDLALGVFRDRLLVRDYTELRGDGSMQRDFTHVNDFVQVMIKAMKRRHGAKDVRVYTVGSENPRSINELLKVLSDRMNRSLRRRVISTQPDSHEIHTTYADSTRAKTELGFVPKLTLEDAIQDFLDQQNPVKVVVVVATRNREKLLRSRALSSIQEQTYKPSKVCIVIDEEPNCGSTDIQSLTEDFPGFCFIRNYRTRGASGAWNSGVMEVTSLPEMQRYTYLAVLDDDDTWERDHLEKCVRQADNGTTDWVISGIVRHENQCEIKQSIPNPNSLKKEDFVMGNPHVQGSNLFVSICLFHRAGMFDEHLPSTTDRDLCIRLFDVAPDLKIETTEAYTVHHYADMDRLRLSSPGSSAKQIGLRRFAVKHLERVDDDQRAKFWKRAELFEVTPKIIELRPQAALRARNIATTPLQDKEERKEKFCSTLWTSEVVSLLFGIISDKPQVAAGIIEDIGKIPNARLLLLANGHVETPFTELMAQHGTAGKVIHSGKRLPIAEARTVLQRHCGHIWTSLVSIDAVVIMDDDKRLPENWFENLRSLLRQPKKPTGGFLGPDMGAPPLPAAFTARCNLLDCFYASLGDIGGSCLECDDPFYDLNSRVTHHLEYPRRASATAPNEIITSVLKGIPLSREAVPNQVPEESTERGGCTVIFDPALLLTVPNPRVSLCGVITRRSDMLWTKATNKVFIKHPLLAVYHDRSRDAVPSVETFLNTAKQDLLGSILCRPEGQRLTFLERRLKQLSSSILRIQGLLEALDVAPTQHFSYSRWVQEVIKPIWDQRCRLANFQVSLASKNGETPEVKTMGDGLLRSFRRETASVLIARQFGLTKEQFSFVASGSEGVVFMSHQGSIKYKVLDAYRPRAATYKGDIARVSREPNSTILVMPFVCGEIYKGGHGPALVSFLRQIQDHQKVCFRNVKPDNLVVNENGVHFIDIGRDVVAYTTEEFEHMRNRTYLSWRFPNHGLELKRYCSEALRDQKIPQLDSVGYMSEAINDRKPDSDLYDFIHEKVKELRLPNDRILDFGSGKAKFQKRTKISGIFHYDPCVDHPHVEQNIANVTGEYGLILCLRVLCVLSPEDMATVLNQVRSFMSNDGRVIFTMCDPRGIERRNPEETASYDKTVCTGRVRPEWYRPLRVVRTALARAGFEIVDESVFWRVDQERFENRPEQWCCVARLTAPPRHTLLIKSCLMEYATIEHLVHHLVETLPCASQVILVLDGKRSKFLRGYDNADKEKFMEKAHRLTNENWIDRLVEPPSKDDLMRLHVDWFSFRFEDLEHWKRKGGQELNCVDDYGSLGVTWTHDEHGVQYASTFHAFDYCQDDLVLQVDSDLMVYSPTQGSNAIKLPYNLFDEDAKMLTWSLPIANSQADPITDGHRFEVRGCLLSRSRLKDLFRRAEVRTEIGETHWYRLVDKHIGPYKSLRGGQKYPFFVHPQNSTKTDVQRYMIALDAVQSHRLHPSQFGRVDWVGMPTTEKRKESIVIVCCGRNVQAGRMVRCIDSIRRNMDQSVGLVVVDDASHRQQANFLQSILPSFNTTFVSRRTRAGAQANLFLACSELIEGEDTIICTVDLDDALLGKPIPMIREMYEKRPTMDAAFGGLVHVNKAVRYEIDATRPVSPREARGQPYWTHLRTFRKVLFDRIEKTDLELTAVEDPLDWAFCVPIWEMARNPHSLPGDLYLYEPSSPDWVRPSRNAAISRIMDNPPYSRRRITVAVIGDASAERGSFSWLNAFEVGQKLAQEDCIILTGGLGGVMEAACRGAKKGDGITVGILPGTDPKDANPHVDIPIPTGLNRFRNGIVSCAEAVIVVGGGAGTYSEAAFAWQLKRLIISMRDVPGCSKVVADRPIDKRVRYSWINDDRIYGASNAEEVAGLLRRLLPKYSKLQSKL